MKTLAPAAPMPLLQESEAPLKSEVGFRLALLPLLLAMPCMYWPKVIDSDTQPWVVIGALIAFLAYLPGRIGSRNVPLNLAVTAAGIAALAAYYVRSAEVVFVYRYAGILGTFLLLWHVASRTSSASVATFVRLTIVIWFVMGLAQTLIVRFGLPYEIFGRFVPGRSGVPSLTAEPSFYGSISVLQLMYLLTEKNFRRDAPYMTLAVLSVLLSGSLLSLLMLVVPAARLPLPLKIVSGLFVLVLVIFGFDLLSSGVFARVQDVDFREFGPEFALRDASTNFRLGHAWFTFIDNLPRELLYLGSADFELEYNGWVSTTPLFLMTDSDFILPSGGELLFRSGAVGAVLLWLIVRTAFRTGGTRYERIERTAFVGLCLINPISLMNPFLSFYIHKPYRQS